MMVEAAALLVEKHLQAAGAVLFQQLADVVRACWSD